MLHIERVHSGGDLVCKDVEFGEEDVKRGHVKRNREYRRKASCNEISREGSECVTSIRRMWMKSFWTG